MARCIIVLEDREDGGFDSSLKLEPPGKPAGVDEEGEEQALVTPAQAAGCELYDDLLKKSGDDVTPKERPDEVIPAPINKLPRVDAAVTVGAGETRRFALTL